ncbi:MAG: DUF4234 domain-containing protein [Coriobacteriales bacterium]|nr:DUF4234 domain-containing protein [Coriobacteriales bacterium]
MICPFCGAEGPDNAKFCGNCGADLRSIGSAGASQHQQPQPQPQPEQSLFQAPQSAQSPQPPQPPQYEEPAQPRESIVHVPGAYTSNNAGAQRPASTPATSVPLSTNRDIALYILLTIITCGIYNYYFVYLLAEDANAICKDDGDETPGILIYILLNIITCGIYNIYWMYKLAERLKTNAPRYNTTLEQGGSEIMLWMILGLFTCGICSFVAMSFIIDNMNKLSQRYNQTYGLA